ncbi:MAG: DNA polymerase I [Succinivibrio sp.]
MSDKFPLVLIDGSSFLYRAFYAARQGFTNSKGVPTGVSLIITKMLQGIIDKFKGAKFVMVFDAKGKSFRSELYKEYKANRPPMPEDLRVQIEFVHAIVRAMGFPLVSIEGVEADDVLGTYAIEATKEGIKTVICTGDKDLSQLVDDNVVLYDSMKDVFYDVNGVAEKFGVAPSHIVDFLALKGDSSDNIPGMAGVGDKTAQALINEIGGIEEIYSNRDKIASLSFRGAKNFAEKFESQIDVIRLSYKLATIKTDVELPFSVKDVPALVPNRQELISIYKELEFKKMLSELLHSADSENTVADTAINTQVSKSESIFSSDEQSALDNINTYSAQFTLVNTEEQLRMLADDIRRRKFVAFDTETTSVDTRNCSIVGMSLSLDDKSACYIPVNHTYLGVSPQLTVAQIKEYLLPALNENGVKIVGHNIKFDLEVMHYQGLDIKLDNVYADTMVLAHLVNSAAAVNMDSLAQSLLNYQTITYKEVVGDKKKIPISEVEVERVLDYAAEDAIVTLRMYEALSKSLDDNTVSKLFFSQEMPLLKVLYKMELNGVYVDASELERQNKVLKTELSELEKQIYASAGIEFNIASPKQLGEVLFDKLKIPYPKKLKAGAKYSTAEDILESISYDYDIANLVLRYRELSKLISTYTEKLQTLIDPQTHRIYASFNQAGTVTGRLSSSDPNLQNIPARTKEGKLIRKAFTAPDGYSIISADYSQIELRLIAHISEDPTLISAFKAGYDIHRATAAEVLQKRIEDVTPQERSHAKATNFGLMYGMGAFGLTRQTHMSMSEAKVYIERYFSKYPAVKKYMEGVKQFARDHEYVEAINGRKIMVSNITSSNTMLQKAAERAAINAPMQGSAADIIKVAMIDISNWIETLPKDTVRMTVQVHDELLFEVKNDFIDKAKQVISDIMEHACELKVPLSVGIESGDNWADSH